MVLTFGPRTFFVTVPGMVMVVARFRYIETSDVPGRLFAGARSVMPPLTVPLPTDVLHSALPTRAPSTRSALLVDAAAVGGAVAGAPVMVIVRPARTRSRPATCVAAPRHAIGVACGCSVTSRMWFAAPLEPM